MGSTSYIMIELMSCIYSQVQKIIETKSIVSPKMFFDKCKTILKQKYRFYHEIDNTNALIEAKHIICLKRRKQMQKKTNTIEVKT